MSSTSSSSTDLTSSEGSCASGGSGVESKNLPHQQATNNNAAAQPVQHDSTATSSMNNYGATYGVNANGTTTRDVYNL
jgi:hypothetical protein